MGVYPINKDKIMTGPQLAFSDGLHATKYREPGEDHREAMGRNASAMCDSEDHYKIIREIFMAMRFMAAGRVQAGMGSTKNVTSHNCFVSGPIEDSFIEGHGSIMARAMEAAATMRMGGGIGYDFSTLRPRGSLIKKLQSQSSGPVSFMDIFDAVCRCIASSGHRRGAQMGVMRVDHPDIVEFIRVKQNLNRLTGFNLSIAITDEFMDCVVNHRPFQLRWGGSVYNEVDANDLWGTVMRSTWDWGEPGVLFIDTINKMNNLYYCETIAATNPCGEQPLPPYGACLLGSYNLVKYLFWDEDNQRWEFDYLQLIMDIPPVVRAMDNVIDQATYPLYEQEKEAKSKRRMGLGVTALANCIEAMGHPYGSSKFLEVQQIILRTIQVETYRASALLAKEKGAFPLFDAEKYLQAPVIRGLPDDVRALISTDGIRNSHLTSIAPTGTISLCADNVSSGIESVFAYTIKRTVKEFDNERKVVIEDYGRRVMGISGKISADVTVDEHLAVLAVAARNVDSSVAKTCNVSGDIPWEDFKNIYIRAWKEGCKGCTTFRPGGMRGGILVAQEEEKEVACYIDPTTGRRECD